ncbi:MAG: RNA methyltransferase, partial [Lachnospiraceae bacterium]|nr:RNA methyltransferase [Lachnospiraceae bacterium]
MITAASNKRIKRIVSLSEKAKERKKEKVFLVEGVKMFEEAEEAYIGEVYVSESYLEKNGVSDKLKMIGYETVSDEVFKKISDTKTPQGILCVMKQYQYKLEELLKKENPVFILLEDIQDPGNLGTILRTGEGAGIDGVIMTKDTVDIYNPKTIRATMGSIYRMPFLYVDSLAEVI